MATTPRPSSASTRSDLKSSPIPRWQQRQLQRNHFLNGSLASRVCSPASPTHAALDLRHDADLKQERPADTNSTSPHVSENTRTPQRSWSSASSSPLRHLSLHVKRGSHPNFLSQATSLDTLTARTSNSWTTCSEAEPDNTSSQETMMSTKDGDKMLSAADRKRKQTLMPLNTAALDVSQGPSTQSSDSEGVVPSARIWPAFEKSQLPDSSLQKGGSRRARGANERESLTALRHFLELDPPPSNGGEVTPEPKSAFDWDSDCEEQKSKVSKLFRRNKKQKETQHATSPHNVEKVERASARRGSVDIPRITSGHYMTKSPTLSRMVEDSIMERGYGSFSGSATVSPPAAHDRSSKTSSDIARSPSARQRTAASSGYSPVPRPSPMTADAADDYQITSKFAPSLGRVASDGDLLNRIGISGNAFAQEEARKRQLPKPEDAIYGANTSQHNVTIWSDATPKRFRFGQKVANKLKISPGTTTYVQSPTGSASSGVPTPSPRGLPHGPEEADWDDAVKWARKEIIKREAREAKEARDMRREAKKEEKRLKKLHAGKEAILRQSQYGFTLKKSVEKLTEDEFEAIGIAAMAMDDPMPTTNTDLLGAFFTQMEGTFQDKTYQRHKISRSLDDHASLQALDSNISGETDALKASQAHHNAALRMLTGERSITDNLTDPFIGIPSSENASLDQSVGLGISGDVASIRHAASQMRLDELRAAKGIEHRSHASGPQPNPPRCDAQTPLYNRPMTTIQEAEKESFSSKSGSGVVIGHDFRDSVGGNASPAVDSIQENLDNEAAAGHAIRAKRDLRVLRYSKEDDAKSIDTIESDAIPAPLDVPRTRMQRMSPSLTNERETGYHSPTIPIIHVSKSSQHIQPSESNSFFPRRNSSFNQIIQETSRLQAAKLGHHPAFRGLSDEDTYENESEYSCYHEHDTRRASIPKHGRVDSGIDFGEGEVVEEESRAIDLDRKDSLGPNASPTQIATPAQRRVPTLVAPSDAVAQQAQAVDIQSLRRELSLAPLELPTGSGAPKHPNHPFTWYHEKIMCFGVHNIAGLSPALPAIPEDQQAPASPVSTPTKTKIPGIKICQSCGINCCRYTNLVLASKIVRSTDITDEAARVNAERRVEKLRAYYPNGIEEYDTFVTCLQCERKVCPGCSTKCMEHACQAIICVDCTLADGICPVHNYD